MKYWLIAGLLAAPLASAQAQEQIEWKQTLSVPKGQNIPRDRADILGIEFGDTYQEAKAKLEALYAETAPKAEPAAKPKPGNPFLMAPGQALAEFSAATERKAPPVIETTSQFQINLPGLSAMYMATYVSKLQMRRMIMGTGVQGTEETIDVYLSAPSSGQQVIGITRRIVYPQAEQPRISEVLAQVAQKYQAGPVPARYAVGSVFVFDDGKAANPSGPTECQVGYRDNDSQDALQGINPQGNCDVVLQLVSYPGISPDHAGMLEFYFGDNERIKANRTADYAYLEAYITDLQNRTRGKVPKL